MHFQAPFFAIPLNRVLYLELWAGGWGLLIALVRRVIGDSPMNASIRQGYPKTAVPCSLSFLSVLSLSHCITPYAVPLLLCYFLLLEHVLSLVIPWVSFGATLVSLHPRIIMIITGDGIGLYGVIQPYSSPWYTQTESQSLDRNFGPCTCCFASGDIVRRFYRFVSISLLYLYDIPGSLENVFPVHFMFLSGYRVLGCLPFSEFLEPIAVSQKVCSLFWDSLSSISLGLYFYCHLFSFSFGDQ